MYNKDMYENTEIYKEGEIYMKSRKRVWIFIVALVFVMTAGYFNKATAVEYSPNKTTIVDADGLDIEVADIVSQETTDVEEYIKANVDLRYSQVVKFEAKDIMATKNIIAQESLIDSSKTIDGLWNNTPEAFIMMNDTYVLLYDLDDNSDYYVAYANTMFEDEDSNVTDYQFAYTNLNGEAIEDAIYDYNTGLAYVPKKYTEENKNGTGTLNIQLELLQASTNANPKTTFDVVVEKDEDIQGNFANSGKATVDSIATEFGLKISLDDLAINSINQNYIKLYVNDSEFDKYVYYEAEGIVVLEELPSTIQNIKVSISKDNVQYNEQRSGDYGISTYSTFDEILTYEDAKEWIASDTPQEGALIKITKDQANMYYDAWDHDNPSGGYQPGIPIYSSGTGDAAWEYLTGAIQDNGSINENDLHINNSWIQWHIELFGTTYVSDDRGVQWEIPAGNWLLKCVHSNVDLGDGTWRQEDPDGYERWHASEMWVRVFKVTDSYLLVGMLTPDANSQAGAGLFKIRYSGGTGNLEVGKKDNHGNWRSGAKLGIWGPDGYYNEVWTEEGKTTVISDLKKGEYRIRELQAPNNMVLNLEEQVVVVRSNQTSQAFINDQYQRGSVKLTKYDERNRGDTQGDATLAGAEFSLYAAGDIYEGPTRIYHANELIKSGITSDENGETPAVDNLPIGSYYYVETKASEGFNINNTHVPVTITYAGPNAQTAATAYCEIPEEPIYNSIEIHKWIGETSSSEKSPLEGAEFTATLKSSIGTDDVKTYKCTAPTDENGYCIIEELPYGEYIIEETVVPEKTLKCSDFELYVQYDEKTLGRKYQMTDVEFVDPKNTLDDVVKDWLDQEGNLVQEPKVMQIKIRKVDANRTDADKPYMTQGDATLKGAIYQIYKFNEETDDYTDYVYDITVDHQDEEEYWVAESKDLLVGKYMVKEKIKYSEKGIDGKTYDYSYAEGYLVDPNEYYFEQEPSKQTVKRTYHMDVSKEEVIRGRARVMKFENNPDYTGEAPAAGAILRLTLNSDTDTYYEATVNENGYAEFIAEEYKEYEPYTIPYGVYTISEVKAGTSGEHSYFYIQHEIIEITNQTDDEKRIESDEPTPAWLRIVKKDKETGQNILLEGAEFKIWDVANSKWVRLMKSPSGEYIDKFETNAEGYFYTPQELQPGEYVVYEVKAPEGYYLEDDLRVPTNEEDLGDAEVSGHKVVVDKLATGLDEDAVYPEGGVATGSLVIEVPMYDPPLKVNLHLNKKGEKLVEATSETISYEINDNGEKVTEEKYTPVYKEVGLEGVGYKIYAAEDIYTPDGIFRVKKGAEVADITTNSEGEAVAKELYPGEYRIVEYKTPEGYLVDKDIPNVVLENKDQYVQNATAKKELSDVRQKLGLTFEKVFRDIKYSNSEEFEQKAMFGIYTNEVVKNYLGEDAIPANKLVDLVWVDENGDVTSNIDLPEGNYYVKELYASYPYDISTIKTNFTLEYNNNPEQEFVIVEGTEFENDYHKATVNLIKLSTATLGDVTLRGNVITTENLQSEIQTLQEEFEKMTKEEIEEYLYENNLLALEGAEYTIFTDSECTKPLYIKNETTGEYEEAVMTSGENGMYTLEDLPINVYWLKETKAPIGHEKSDDVVKLEFSNTLNNADVYRILVDDGVNGEIIKTDIFTGELVPNCVFEIRDEDDNLIVKSTTDENGIAGFPIVALENGKKYTYTEIEAPEIYNLNTEPHEFKASYEIKDNDIIWTGEKLEVDNIRKTREVIVRKLDAETGEPLKGCVFTIAMIDPETGEQKVNAKTGEPIYLVENVETDENGEYIIPEAPMGTYKFLEIKAPEGYELDEDLTGYTFTIDNNSPETIIFEVTNTGDIAVIAIASVAVICAVGIVFVLKRNRKQA